MAQSQERDQQCRNPQLVFFMVVEWQVNSWFNGGLMVVLWWFNGG